MLAITLRLKKFYRNPEILKIPSEKSTLGIYFALFGKFPLIRIHEKFTLKSNIYGNIFNIQYLFGQECLWCNNVLFLHLGCQIGYFD